MKDCSKIDLSLCPNSQKALKKSIPVMAYVAECSGILETLEGQVHYEAGDAIATGSKGERWPIKQEDFLRMYVPCPSNESTTVAISKNQTKPYMKKPATVYVLQMKEPFFVSKNQGTLKGKAGDWLVQHTLDDLAVVAADIFPLYYAIADSSC